MTTTNVTMQQRRDTSANWKTNNPVINSGEICFETDTGKMKIGNGKDNYLSLPYKANDDIYKMTDKLYDGVDLSVKFADEIKNYSDVWAWIKARITANNYDGIHVGDYIPFALSAGTISDGSTSMNITAKTMQAQIAGIDTYYGYGYPIPANNDAHTVGHHIDFISKQTIGTNIQWNPTDNNNGTATQQNPWLSSKIYACLNGINNESTNAYNNVKHGYNASSGGVLQLLPTALQNVIKQKVNNMEKKYSASGLVTEVTGLTDFWGMGKLWLPSETEVYGMAIHSASKGTDGRNYANWGTPVQYPLFAGSNSYRNCLNKNRVHWWLSSVCGGSSSCACGVGNYGHAHALGCTGTDRSAPVCFRVEA